MKIAYIILAHKNIPQIQRLMETIQDDNVSIYLHLDLLAGNQIYQEALTGLKDINSLIFLKRYPTNWGGFGLVQATLEGMRQILANDNFDYALLLSGQDYPIKSRRAMEQLLEENDGDSFLEYYPFPHPYWKDNGGYDRINKWSFTFPVRQTAIIKKVRGYLIQTANILLPQRKFPLGLLPFGGSQWWCLHRECIKYIYNYTKNNEQFVRFFKYVRIPDEIFFHTILLNSPLSCKIINRKLTYVDWNGPPFPRFLNEEDTIKIMNSPYQFARKFDLNLTPDIFKVINEYTNLR